mmetsp:Transcript_20331/g.37782  ORF Transcript_20331/g.37782 Transcript_20331/m.37782 type:complete len:86 (-) Transcript_20331:51-308(-)
MPSIDSTTPYSRSDRPDIAGAASTQEQGNCRSARAMKASSASCQGENASALSGALLSPKLVLASRPPPGLWTKRRNKRRSPSKEI